MTRGGGPVPELETARTGALPAERREAVMEIRVATRDDIPAGADAVWLGTDPGTRAERFYRAAGWRHVGTAPNGEARYELSRAEWEAR